MIGLLGLVGWKVTVISSNFIALMLILNMAMNIHLTVRFLQLKKEFPQLNKKDAVFESRLMTRLLFKSGINSNNYSLDVVGGTVYAIGLAENLDEKTKIEDFLSKMQDIRKLVTIINIKKLKD